MKELLRKDYRLNRTLLLLIVTAVAALYLTGAIMEISSGWPQLPPIHAWREMFGFYGIVAQFLTICIAALLGGNAIACERSDRSANFLAYLPPTKLQILTSKFLFASGVTITIWAWAIVCLHVIAPHDEADFTEQFDPLSLQWSAATCVLAFGVGWLASAFMEKPIVPVLLALLSPVLVQVSLDVFHSVLHVNVRPFSSASALVNAGVGASAFVFGTWYYFWRVEP